MSEYKPRRQSKRWLDGDCPKGVLAIFDHPKFGDRYTVFYAEVYGGEGREGYLWGRGMSSDPASPRGVGMTFERRPHEVAAYRYRESHYAAKWSSLPEAVKACVRRDLAPEKWSLTENANPSI